MGFPKKETYKLQCEWGQCRQTYEDMDEFYKHLDEHFWTDIASVQMESGLVCQWCECNFVTTNGHDLIRHLYFHGFHTKVKWLGFLKHEEEKTGECQINQNRNIIPELPDGFKCCWDDCFIVVDIPDKYYEHVREHAVIADPETLSNGKKGFKCCWEGCNYEYAFGDKHPSLGRHKLRGHLTTHTQERCYACPWCGNLYVNKTKLIDHYTRQINVENHTFQCTHCSRTFASERILKDHMRHHVNHYQCPKCAMTCPNPSALKHHMRYKHSTERPYACEFCEYRSKEPHDLQTHMQFHQSDLSYHCQVADCDYVVRSIQNLRYHYRVKHGSGDGKLYACHLCDKKYGTGCQLTHHLRKVHNFQWPPGHCRFRYKECEDGMFRLQIFRYESIELTKKITLEASAAEAETDSANGNASSAHIKPSGSTTIVQRMNVERKNKGAATRRNSGHPGRNLTKIPRNVGKPATAGIRKSARKTRQRVVKTIADNSKETGGNEDASKQKCIKPAVPPSVTLAEDSNMPDLYYNSECLAAADTLCTMKTNSAKKRNANISQRVENEEGLDGVSDRNFHRESLPDATANDISPLNKDPARSGSQGKPTPLGGRLRKAKKRLLMTSTDVSSKKIRCGQLELIKECSVELIPLDAPVFANHHKIYEDPTNPQQGSEVSPQSPNTGTSGSLVATWNVEEPKRVPGGNEVEQQHYVPNVHHSGEISIVASSVTTSFASAMDHVVAPMQDGVAAPAAAELNVGNLLVPVATSGACPVSNNASTSPECTSDKQFCNLEPPRFLELESTLPETSESGDRECLEGDMVSYPKRKSDDGKLVEVNSSELVTDEDGNRTVINVDGEEFYLVSGTDTKSGSKVYCLVQSSEFVEGDG